MANSEYARWEASGRTAGQYGGAWQINRQSKERAIAYQRLTAEARLAAESDVSKPTFKAPQLALLLLIGFSCVFLWFMAF